MSEEKNKSFFSSLFNKEEAINQAESYQDIAFHKKTKNILIFFYLGVGLLSIFMSESLGLESLIGIIIYWVFLPFVYLNHRWAIVLLCLLYISDKIYFLAMQVGAPISQILFGLVATALSYNAFITAMHLKKIESPKEQ